MKTQLNIVLGNSEDVINEALSERIEKAVEEKYRLNVTSFFYLEDIEDYARRYPIDLFVIVVNNVTLRQENPSDDRIEKVLEFIREFKDSYNRPVIALYGWPDDPHFSDKIKQAGANFCFKMPCKLEDFEKTVRVCLRVASY